MSDVLTFFCPRSSKGVVRQFPSTSGTCHYFVDGTGKLPAPEPSDNWHQYSGRLPSELKGAFIVEVSSNVVTFSRVSTKKSSDLPKTILRLPVAGSARPYPIDWGQERVKLTVEPWEHLIVPVDSDAEAKLNQFLQFLRYLPEAYESSVLNLLRRPSLEWRITRLEEWIQQSPSDKSSSAAPFSLLDPPTRRSSPARAGDLTLAKWTAVALAILLLGLGVVGSWAYREMSTPSARTEPATGPGQTTANPTDKNPSSGEAAGGEPAGDAVISPQQQFGDLLNALKTSKGEAHRLLATHSLNGDNWLSSDAALAVLKLELLRDGSIKGRSEDLNSPNELTDTSKALGKKAGELRSGRTIWTDRNVAPVLTYFTCKAFKRAQIPLGAPIPGEKCNPSPSDQSVTQGLKDLTEWVSL